MCNTAKHNRKAHSLTACGFCCNSGGRVPAQAKTANKTTRGTQTSRHCRQLLLDIL